LAHLKANGGKCLIAYLDDDGKTLHGSDGGANDPSCFTQGFPDVTMGMYLFALIMIVLNVAAFGPGLFRREEKPTVLEPEGAAS